MEPIWIRNANPDGAGSIEPNDTFMTAFGGRLRIRPSVYLVGEWAPRLTGYAPGTPHGSFAIEKRVGGHVFQLNFSNAVGTTMAQVARGGLPTDDWYLGFNISRRFN